MMTCRLAFLFRIFCQLMMVLILLLVVFLPSSLFIVQASSFDFDDDYVGLFQPAQLYPGYNNFIKFSTNWYYYKPGDDGNGNPGGNRIDASPCLYNPNKVNPNSYSLVGGIGVLAAGTPGSIIEGTIEFPNGVQPGLDNNIPNPIIPVKSFSVDYSSGAETTLEAYGIQGGIEKIITTKTGSANLGTGQMNRLTINAPNTLSLTKVVIKTLATNSAVCRGTTLLSNQFPYTVPVPSGPPYPYPSDPFCVFENNRNNLGSGTCTSDKAFLIIDNVRIEGSSLPTRPTYTYSNPLSITFPAITAPGRTRKDQSYYSSIKIANLRGKIAKVTAMVNVFSYSQLSDLEFVLVGPDNTAVVLMSEAWRTNGFSNVQTVIFDDDAPTGLPDNFTYPSGQGRAGGPTLIYKPTDNSDKTRSLADPAPKRPYQQTLNAFINNKTPPNGEWRLYYYDRASNSTSATTLAFNGWSLTIETEGVDAEVTQTGSPNPVQPEENITYSIRVNDRGPDPAQNLTLTDNIPANTTFQSLSAPTGWACNTPVVGATGQVSCSIPSLNLSSADFTLVVKVDPKTASGTNIANTANVNVGTTGLADYNLANNSATAIVGVNVPYVAVPLTNPADLIPQLRVTPDRVAGNNPDNLISYSFKVNNVGTGTASALRLELSIDPGLEVGFASFTNDKVWVTQVTTSTVYVSLPPLDKGDIVSGTITFRPKAEPAPTPDTKVSTRYTLRYDDPTGGGKQRVSNAVTFSFGEPGNNQDVAGGAVQLLDPDFSSSNPGNKLTYNATFLLPDEPVNTWLTRPDGTSVALGSGMADRTGNFSQVVDTTNLAPGTYVVAIYGNRSEVTGSGILLVVSP